MSTISPDAVVAASVNESAAPSVGQLVDHDAWPAGSSFTTKKSSASPLVIGPAPASKDPMKWPPTMALPPASDVTTSG
ncbi:MAG: hypothetical protein WKG00_34310 [Polyangiaceae bacterium]